MKDSTIIGIRLNDDGTSDVIGYGRAAEWCQRHGLGIRIAIGSPEDLRRYMNIDGPSVQFDGFASVDQPDIITKGAK